MFDKRWGKGKRAELSYMGLADFSFVFFFQLKSLKICSRSVLIFRGFLLNSVNSIVERKANSTIERQQCKGHEKRDRLLKSKLEINYQIFQ